MQAWNPCYCKAFICIQEMHMIGMRRGPFLPTSRLEKSVFFPDYFPSLHMSCQTCTQGCTCWKSHSHMYQYKTGLIEKWMVVVLIPELGVVEASICPSTNASEANLCYTVVPRFTITLFNDETALRWTFCDRFCDRFTMFPMGEFHFAIIGSLLREPILRKTMIFGQLIGSFKMATG